MPRTAPFGQELDWMLRGDKPIAVFYKVVGENFDETDGQDFSRHVASGTIVKTRFFVRNEGQDFTIMYTAFALHGEEWRLAVYKSLKKEGTMALVEGYDRD